jgi:hypothetical protein
MFARALRESCLLFCSSMCLFNELSKRLNYVDLETSSQTCQSPMTRRLIVSLKCSFIVVLAEAIKKPIDGFPPSPNVGSSATAPPYYPNLSEGLPPLQNSGAAPQGNGEL